MIVIRNGTIYDGTGSRPYRGDVAIEGDRISAVESRVDARAGTEIDASGLAVAPGFINMLSWAGVSLIADGRSQSDIRQGVTLEVMGEGWSGDPLNDAMKQEAIELQADVKYGITWTTLGEYLDQFVERGVSCNVASFVGSATVRIHELGYEDRPPSAEELDRMRGLVRQAMEEGAVGISSALIYVPSTFADTAELVELSKVAAEYGGMYISHLRSEGNRLVESVEELITISREAGIAAEIYHLKATGQANWHKMEQVIKTVEAAQAEGLKVTADMYTYTAGSTGLEASMPPWVQEGGHRAWIERLKNPEVRARVAREIATPTDEWENFYLQSGSPENVQFVGFKNEDLKPLTGKTLAAVAAARGKSPEETIIDLVVEDDSRVDTVYFLMSEDNLRREVALPWVSFGSDAGSLAPEGIFLKSSTHPRAYGTFARLLGKYVRDEGIVPLEEAVRRLTSLPAANLKLKERGLLRPGHFADVVVFDPAAVRDNATFTQPQQYASGMAHVLVNGVPVLKDGEHTGATPGRVVRGPGWRPGQ
ncbi:MAG TPA: D-aminoacylase [Chloroflexia bacterium]|nr:D-aminoacylase [Chloroflexia bacterium]